MLPPGGVSPRGYDIPGSGGGEAVVDLRLALGLLAPIGMGLYVVSGRGDRNISERLKVEAYPKRWLEDTRTATPCAEERPSGPTNVWPH
jgi:hypothetical protein